MNLMNKWKEQYQKYWKLLIRPRRNTYPQTSLGPQNFKLIDKNIKRQDFKITNSRGYVMYCSHFIPQETNQYPCMIYAHGNSSNRTQGMQYIGSLLKQNISLCTFDFSGCGNSEGQYISLGYYESQDLHEIVSYIKNKPQVTSIGLWGRSMGAVSVLLYMLKSQYVSVIILDSPFKSLQSLVENLCQKNSKIPTVFLKIILKIIDGTIQQKANFSLYDINPLKNSIKFLKFPAYFIVGASDQLIPLQHTKLLYSEYKGNKKYLDIVKGGHNDCRPGQTVHKAVQFFLTNINQIAQLQNESQCTNKSQTINEDLDEYQNIEIIKNNIQYKQQKQQYQEIDFFNEENIKKADQIINFNFSLKQQKQINNTNINNVNNYNEIDLIFMVQNSIQSQKNCIERYKYQNRMKKQLNKLQQKQFQKQINQHLKQWSFSQ